jgi:polysaccharide pyruvyl transferase WcaK-like protein
MAHRFCIVGGGFQNKGAEAMLLTTTAAIRRRLPDAAIFARVPRTDYAPARAERIRPLSIGEAGLLRKFISKVKTATLIADGTCLIDISGFQFGDDWSYRIAERRAATVRRFAMAGNPVFFLSQAWGPFNGNLRGAKATQSLLEHATLSFVRDKLSEQAVLRLAPTAPIRFAHDLAWNFEAGSAELAANRIREAGLDPTRRGLTVCVTPNLRVYERSDGRGADNAHVKLLVSMIRHLVRHYDAQVVLVGHELRPAGSTTKDDRYLCDTVKK